MLLTNYLQITYKSYRHRCYSLKKLSLLHNNNILFFPRRIFILQYIGELLMLQATPQYVSFFIVHWVSLFGGIGWMNQLSSKIATLFGPTFLSQCATVEVMDGDFACCHQNSQPARNLSHIPTLLFYTSTTYFVLNCRIKSCMVAECNFLSKTFFYVVRGLIII